MRVDEEAKFAFVVGIEGDGGAADDEAVGGVEVVGAVDVDPSFFVSGLGGEQGLRSVGAVADRESGVGA